MLICFHVCRKYCSWLWRWGVITAIQVKFYLKFESNLKWFFAKFILTEYFPTSIEIDRNVIDTLWISFQLKWKLYLKSKFKNYNIQLKILEILLTLYSINLKFKIELRNYEFQIKILEFQVNDQTRNFWKSNCNFKCQSKFFQI